jgi:zinc protease
MIKPFVLFIALATAGFAQEGAAGNASTYRGMVRLNRAPVSNEVLKIKLPRPVERKLSNGLKLLVLETHRLPTISLTIRVPSAALRNPENLPGLAQATAAMMMLGTNTRTAKQISDELGEIGATVGVNAGVGNATISISSLTENFPAALAIASDVLLHPSFPPDEFEKWKTRQRSALEQAKAQPGVLMNEQVMKVLYPGDVRRATRITAEALNQMTRENLIGHYRKFYVPADEWAGIAGDINPQEAVAILEKAFGSWKGGPIEAVSLPINPPIAEKKVYLVSRPGSVQTSIELTNRAIERTNPDYIACLVMNQVLGDGPAARLFRIIREEKGYTYGVYSGFSATRYMQHFDASMSVRNEVTESALTDLLKEFHEIRDVPVPKEELDGAKRTIVGQLALRLESPAGVLGQWLQQREYGLPDDYWDTYPGKIMAITAADVQRVAKKYVPYDNVQIIAVGDSAKIRDILKKFGPVVEVSPDSN